MRYPKASKQERTAPEGKFRLIALDLRENLNGYCLGDFETVESAKQVARDKGGIGQPVFVYDDTGEAVMRFGSWH